MNFDKLFSWIAGIVIASAAAGHLDDLQNWVWRAQPKLFMNREVRSGEARGFLRRRSLQEYLQIRKKSNKEVRQ